jgi:hypothetical protein
MRGAAGRTLGIVSSLFLALPPGWCCLVGPRDCCAGPPRAREVPPSAGGCCCCPEQTTRDSSDPVPPHDPAKPCKSACCQREPSARPSVERHLPDLAGLPLAGPFALPLVARAEAVASWPAFVILSPPRHVLHCVWLC